MSDTQHVSRDELLKMLGSDDESQHTNRIGEHLHQCTSCRDKLDSLAAQSEIWNKAPSMLKSDLPVRASLSSHGLETRDLPKSQDKDSEDSSSTEWSWPIDTILDPPRHPEMIGRIGDYDIEREVGRGGMGIVLKAHDSELNRPLAIKVLSPHLASHGTARQRFAKEARSAAGVIHPNVIGVYRVENGDKIPYIVMPYINGPSLQKLVEDQGPLSEEQIVQMALQISAGLTAAHSHGLVHRDIKPANMLVAEGGNRVTITDFGLARAEDDVSLTRTGWLTGTPNYMSPEQTKGERLDHRSDLFSLGSLIYFLATGRLPFRNETPFGVLRRIQEDAPTPVRQVNRDISRTLADIIDMLLEKDPADRFQSAAELHEVLSKQMFYLHQPDTSQPPVVKKELSKPVSNGGWFRGGITAAIFAAGFGAWMLTPFFFPQEEESKPQKETPVVVIEQDSELNEEELQAEIESKIAELQIEKKALAEAKVILIQKDEVNSEAQIAFELGMELLSEKKYSEAIESFKESAKHENFKSISTYNIACGYALKGEPEKALLNLERAVDAGFDDYSQFENDSDLKSLRDDERFKELLADLKEIEQAREQLHDAIAMSDRGEFGEAAKLIQEVMEIDPNNEKAWLNLGYAIHMQGDLDEALKWHKKAAAGKQFAPIAQYNVACVYAIKGLKNEAFASLDTAFEKGLINHLGLDHIKNDSDLENLRDDDRFEKFIARFAEAKNAMLKSLNVTLSTCPDCDSEDCENCEHEDVDKDDSASSSDDSMLNGDAEAEEGSELEESEGEIETGVDDDLLTLAAFNFFLSYR